MFAISPLLAFGFSNLAMLAWLAAAAAPLLIHLWSRHRFREAPWAAMQFLLAAMRKNARRLQLQQWLLLAVRTLIIVLVVLAAAEPYAEQLLAGGSAASAHKVLVLDGSYSMAYGDDGTSRFSRARHLAAALVRDSRPADTFTVILMAAPARTILGPEVVDHGAVAAQIESLSQAHTGAHLQGTVALIEEALADQSHQRASSQRHEVYFFTDLQSRTWSPAPDYPARPSAGSAGASGDEEATARRLAAFAQHANVAVIDLGEPHAANLAVTDLAARDPLVTVDREVAFDVTLRQFGDEPRRHVAVELLVNDEPVGEQAAHVPAGGDVAVHFTHRFQKAGDHAVTVRAAADDGLAIDNSRYLVVPVREEIRVLCVAGHDGAATYLANALNPDPAGRSPIRPVVVSEGDLAEMEFADFDCVFLSNVAQLGSNEAQRLRRYAEQGGGIVIFLGDRVEPDHYHALARGEQPLLPAAPGELVSQPQPGLDPLDYRHPIVAPFRGRERAGLLTTPIRHYFRLNLPEDRPDVQIAVATASGDPVIVTAPLGRGRTVLVATAASLASLDASGEPWTHWPTWPSFLPIVRELLTFAAGAQQHRLQQPVGSPLGGTLAAELVAGTAPKALQIVRPDGRADFVSVLSPASHWEWSYDATDLSGAYLLRGLPRAVPQQFAINVDTAESDLAKADPRQLPPQFSVNDTALDAADSDAAPRLVAASWHQSLLWVALALLFTESLLAWQFGRGAL